MSEFRGALYANKTESTAIDSGVGRVFGVVANSHSSGTIALIDGTAGGGVEASGVLTSSGAAAPADYAIGTLTSDATNVTDADTCTINTTVYQFKTTTAAAYDVKIGASAAATLDNLKLAINASGVGDGTDYHAGTSAHPEVIATTNTDTTQVIRAKVIGTAPNAYATTEASTHLSWGAVTLESGVAVTAATITIDSVVYTAVLTLPESLGYTAVPYYVLWVTSEAVFLDNLKQAINLSGLQGTDYSAGTEIHPTVEATTNTNTAQTVVAKSMGTGGNSIATTETVANYAWGATTLENGAGVTSRKIINTFTFATGSQVLEFPEPISYVNGLYITIGGTLDCTVLYQPSA